MLPVGVTRDASTGDLVFENFTGRLPLSLVIPRVPETQATMPPPVETVDEAAPPIEVPHNAPRAPDEHVADKRTPPKRARDVPEAPGKPSRPAAVATTRCVSSVVALTGKPPESRWGCTATSVGDGKVIVFGGEGDAEQALSDVCVLDGGAWEHMVGADGPPRSWHSAVYSHVSNCILVFGGRAHDAFSEVDDVHAFDCELNLWFPMQTSGKPPAPRQGHSAVILGDKMVVFGGSRRRVWFNDVHVLDVKTLRWTALENVQGVAPAARSYHNAVALSENSMLVFGGNSGDAAFNDVHVLTLHGGEQATWSQPAFRGGDLAPPERCGAVLMGPLTSDGSLVLAGGWDVLKPTEVEVFDDVWKLFVDQGWKEQKDAGLRHVTGAAAWTTGDCVHLFGGQGAPPASKRSNDVVALGFVPGASATLPADKPTPTVKAQAATTLDANAITTAVLSKCGELGLDAVVVERELAKYLKPKKTAAVPTVESALQFVMDAALDVADGPAAATLKRRRI